MRDNLQPLLKAHARSFALTLRLLPKSLREPLSLGYLLARASDTVADASGLPWQRRLELLTELKMNLDWDETIYWKPEFEVGEITESERKLMDFTPKLMALLEQSEDRAELLSLWRTILEGQIFDLQRFGDNVQPLGQAELKKYCYFVAGSVGETWTRLIARNSPQTLLASLDEMTKLGRSYGMGLQLLNIVRDRPVDRELGRVYVQEKDIPEMIKLTAAWLSEGKEYCARLHPGRIRYGSEIPLGLALKTLDRIRKSPSAVWVKIPRSAVYGVLLQTLPSLILQSS